MVGLICGLLAVVFSLKPALLATGGDEMMAFGIRLFVMGGAVTIIGFIAAWFCGNRWLWSALNLGFPIIFITADHIKPIDLWGKEEVRICVDNATSENIHNVGIVFNATDLSTIGWLRKGQEGTIMCFLRKGQRLTVVVESEGGKTYKLDVPIFEWNERSHWMKLTIRDAQIGQRVSEGGSLFTVVVEK